MNIHETLEQVQTHPFVARSSDELLQAVATELILRQGKHLQKISHENKLPLTTISTILALFPDKLQVSKTTYVHETGGCTITIMFVTEHGIIVQNINEFADKREPIAYLNMLLTNDVSSDIITTIITSLRDKKTLEGPTVDLFTTDSRGSVRIETIPMPEIKWQRDNYSDEVLAGIEDLKEVLLTPNQSKGRLSILQGKPGCGKTMFIRSLVSELHEDPVSFIFAPTSVGLQLTSPSFLSVLFNYKQDNPETKIVLVLEDADLFVESRDGASKVAVSEFLNATDGIIGATLDLHIIATTNLKKDNFDEAIERPGRLHMLMRFETLPFEQAKRVYKRECGRDDLPAQREGYTLAEIYARAKAHDNKAKKKHKLEVGSYA